MGDAEVEPLRRCREWAQVGSPVIVDGEMPAALCDSSPRRPQLVVAGTDRLAVGIGWEASRYRRLAIRRAIVRPWTTWPPEVRVEPRTFDVRAGRAIFVASHDGGMGLVTSFNLCTDLHGVRLFPRIDVDSLDPVGVIVGGSGDPQLAAYDGKKHLIGWIEDPSFTATRAPNADVLGPDAGCTDGGAVTSLAAFVDDEIQVLDREIGCGGAVDAVRLCSGGFLVATNTGFGAGRCATSWPPEPRIRVVTVGSGSSIEELTSFPTDPVFGIALLPTPSGTWLVWKPVLLEGDNLLRAVRLDPNGQRIVGPVGLGDTGGSLDRGEVTAAGDDLLVALDDRVLHFDTEGRRASTVELDTCTTPGILASPRGDQFVVAEAAGDGLILHRYDCIE